MNTSYTRIQRFFAILTLILCLSCTPEEDACFETVCYGPDGTDCVEEPIWGDSSCFVPDPGS
ncbi:hypothetical protein [Maribacter halichondriae]|uniref:hypothetical protein n=1 Tax=Maribacter halichondriae TaxID=2980554 RepID=UPI00235A1CB3|nr:hypothetical protein [Maribacter sp. Hal144]